jgi:hypothetical protein
MLLERSDQLAALAEALAEARDSSRGTLALVAGEAGVGPRALRQHEPFVAPFTSD